MFVLIIEKFKYYSWLYSAMGKMITTIQVEENTKNNLDKLKIHERESYNEVIRRMLSECSGKRIDEGCLKETIDILSDPETLRDIAEALNEYSEGKFVELR